jgi:hypothetical protein
MLEKLIQFIHGPYEPHDPFTRLDSVVFDDKDARLGVSVMDHGGDETWSRWSVEVRGLRDYEVVGPGGELSFIVDDHVLSRQHTDGRQSVSFRGTPTSALETVGRLWIAHQTAVGDWIPFERFINPYNNLEGLLKGGFGEVAVGPSFLMETYARVLNGDGVETYTSSLWKPKRWDGEKLIEDSTRLVTLTIGSSFFVAEEFEEHLLGGKG